MNFRIEKFADNPYGDYYIYTDSVNGEYENYLHSDGIIRNTTVNEETGKFTGYFTSREAAQACIDSFHSSGNSSDNPLTGEYNTME